MASDPSVCQPATSRPRGCPAIVSAAVVLLGAVWGVGVSARQPMAVAPTAMNQRPVTIRVQWGGGKPCAWTGFVRLISAVDGSPARDVEWRTLCTAPDAAAMLHEDGGIVVHETRPLEASGVEAVVSDWRGLRCLAELRSVDGRQAPVSIDLPLRDLLVGPVQRPLDGDGNRLTAKHAAGDGLRVAVNDAAGNAVTVPRPGETIHVTVDPLLVVKADHVPEAELRLRIRTNGSQPDPPALAAVLEPLEDDDERQTAGLRLMRFRPVEFQLSLPTVEGVCDLEIEAVERGGLRWSRTLASRTVQVVAVDERPSAADETPWSLVHEVDPGSPRLHERLRRLPAVGLPAMPLPPVSLPAMPFPSLSRPNVPLPNVPLPKLPQVPVPTLPQMPAVPSVASMVPRLSGLLASGHSVIEPHTLGTMLRLPAADDAAEPSWEAVVVVGVRPGMPHMVEVEYPSDQDAVIGLSVLELDASERLVVPCHHGGFSVSKPQPYEMSEPRLETHRFVFWPTTRQPVILVSNPSMRSAALLGKIRVLAGPSRLSAALPAGVDAGRIGGITDPRRVHGFLPEPDFSRFGGATRMVRGVPRSVVDWQAQLDGMRHSAELLSARAAGGAMVVVHSQGGSLWPSSLTMHAPRWSDPVAAEAGLDPAPKDMLAALCRVYARAGLGLVPALSFDAPVPSLERRLAAGGADAVGIACVGRDGQPLRLGKFGTVRYNILDPRVQAAVEEQVRELAARVRGQAVVDGLAIVMSHDGWTHLPDVSAGIDDVTFGRFLAAMGAKAPPAAENRFAERAGLVEGTLRDLWLEWRTAEIAALHGRLAKLVAEHDERWSLYLAPTSLLAGAGGGAAIRSTQQQAVDMLREVGLDPSASTAHQRVVFVFPHVHVASDEFTARAEATSLNASQALAASAAACRRRGVVLVEQPLEFDPRSILPHGPFGTAAAAGPCRIHAPIGGIGRDRSFVESLVAADAEIVFDMGMVRDAAPPAAQRAYESLASRPLQAVAGTPAPLVARSLKGRGTTRVCLLNASSVGGAATLWLAGRTSVVVDAVTQEQVDIGDGGMAIVPLSAWGMRTLLVDGDVDVQAGRIDFAPTVAEAVSGRVASLRRRRRALDTPQALDLLDNPDFEIGGDAGGAVPAVPGWELVESRRGTLTLVPGFPAAEPAVPGRGIGFSSVNGLSTLRSNPFSPPATGRLSVSVWLRIRDGDPQPPLRLALEGVLDDKEFYRFASVGGVVGARPLTPEWSRYVLQVDELPAAGLESLRVRFDLLGPGSVQIDQVQLFDLAFDESQRVTLSRRITRLEKNLVEGKCGECLVALEGYWPRFLETFVTDPGPERVATAVETPASQAAPPRTPPAPGMLDRLRGWWQ